MKKIKKLIVIALATTMLLGATITASAASCSYSQVSWGNNCRSCGAGSFPLYKCSVHSGEYKCGSCWGTP